MWKSIETLPDFNGRVEVKIRKNGKELTLFCWYETGNRRFPQGFSQTNPKLIPFIVEWRKV